MRYIKATVVGILGLAICSIATSAASVEKDAGRFSAAYYDEFCDKLKSETGIKPEQVWWTYTHTHSSPSMDRSGLSKQLKKERDFSGENTQYLQMVQRKLLQAVINLPMVLYSGGFVMHNIFGLNMVLSIWILVIAAGSYTIFGGLSAVAWVDLFNGILLIGDRMGWQNRHRAGSLSGNPTCSKRHLARNDRLCT